MYFEEEIIDGILHWRDTPNGDWTPYTDKQLSDQVVMVKGHLNYILGEYRHYTDVVGSAFEFINSIYPDGDNIPEEYQELYVMMEGIVEDME